MQHARLQHRSLAVLKHQHLAEKDWVSRAFAKKAGDELEVLQVILGVPEADWLALDHLQ